MTMPAYNSFQLYKGDTLKFTLTLNSSGSAYFIPEGSVFSGSIKEKNKTSVTANFDSSILSAEDGVILFTLPSSQSALLDAKKNWIYDIQIEQTGGIVKTLMAGSMFVTDQVTP
jgi:hypothetical protein